jgi:hypothetical protein
LPRLARQRTQQLAVGRAVNLQRAVKAAGDDELVIGRKLRDRNAARVAAQRDRLRLGE